MARKQEHRENFNGSRFEPHQYEFALSVGRGIGNDTSACFFCSQVFSGNRLNGNDQA